MSICSITSRFYLNLGLVELASTAYKTDAPFDAIVGMKGHEEIGQQFKSWLESSLGGQTGGRANYWLGFAYNTSGLQQQAVEQWHLSGVTSLDLTRRGYSASFANALDAATQWFVRAQKIAPQSAEPLYHLGQMQERQQQFDEAIFSYEQALQKEQWGAIAQSDLYFRLGSIYWSSQPLHDLERAYEMYTMAIDVDQFSAPEIKAEAFYKRGEIHRVRKDAPERQVEQYRRAVEIRSNHRWAKVRLAVALYQAEEDLAGAESLLHEAIDGWPDDSLHKWSYIYLGNIYADAGLTEKAIGAFEQAALLAPDDQAVQDRIQALK